jgi:hypothetical protein
MPLTQMKPAGTRRYRRAFAFTSGKVAALELQTRVRWPSSCCAGIFCPSGRGGSGFPAEGPKPSQNHGVVLQIVKEVRMKKALAIWQQSHRWRNHDQNEGVKAAQALPSVVA